MARLKLRQRTVTGFWRLLDVVGVEDAQGRWRQRPLLVQRAVPPVAIAVLVIAICWGLGLPPDPSLLILLAITYVLYMLPPRGRRYAVPATVLTLAVLYPIYLSHLFAPPVIKTFPSMDTMVLISIFAMMAIGLNMVVGYAGLLDLGYVAFYAIGAYVAAWLASPHFSQVDFSFGAVGVFPGLKGIHLSFWLVLVIAACVTAVLGMAIGLPTLRLRGDYLAIVTLGFGEILPQIARNGTPDELSQLFGTRINFNLTNGPPGINPIDAPGFGETLGHIGLPANYLAEQGLYVNFVSLIYWTAIGLCVITIFCSLRLRDSRLGRAWIAIREDETAAAAMGIPLMRTKTYAYAGGAFFGGLAGAWYAAFTTSVFPDQFFFNISVLILCMVILGGMGNVWGVIGGAVLLTYLNFEGLSNITEWFNTAILDDTLGVCDPGAIDPSQVVSAGACFNAPLVQYGIYGVIIVLVMLFRPQGMFPEKRRELEFKTGVHDTPIQDEQA